MTAGAGAQSPVFVPALEIDQTKLVTNCPIATDAACAYSFKDVLASGGDFWTTPFTPYDPVAKTGDGYGEGVNGPRADQRRAFNPQAQDPPYRFLRLNGLDSQSCFECHNSIGSAPVDARGAMMRKPGAPGGSAGSNSNAFINPLYPTRQTLFIRNPPMVFGSGYQQAVGDEMTIELLLLRDRARAMAKRAPGQAFVQPLTAKGIGFGTFTTTYVSGSPAKVLADAAFCPAGVSHPESIGGAAGYTDDLTKLDGVSCDLIIRPFQWKGVSSGLRHFVRDALDFHFSMQAFEKVGFCDCDRDGKGTPTTGPEVTIGNVTAMSSFVAMLRPPVQLPLTTPEQKRGQEIFFGKAAGSYQNMCANCHIGSSKLTTATAPIEWPSSAQGNGSVFIDPATSSTWPITPQQCPSGIPPTTNSCPIESSYSASRGVAALSSQNRGALVTPVASSQQLPVVRRYKENLARLSKEAGFDVQAFSNADRLAASVATLRKSPTAVAPSVIGQDYVLPLNPPDSVLTPMQLPRLKANGDGTIDVPLFSDLKRHNMGRNLTDPPPPAPSQGTDVADINTRPQDFMTRPLWGVADTGPWLHDGRAMTLKEAILFHGDQSTGSDAGPVIAAFKQLSAGDQNAVVSFLETLRLPLPGSSTP
ncbi:MAG TPA: di-heme oxidoredictase family protein [Reyranella sp.]|nr:di-heme oxidoredictase family protein [Reyranella sp.]